MPGQIDVVYVLAAVIAAVVVTFIVRAVRLTNASITTASRHVNLANPDAARSVAEQIRRREVPCPRCGCDTFALLGTGTRYQCETCAFEFEGPAHIQDSP